jgi:hypothetical protein
MQINGRQQWLTVVAVAALVLFAGDKLLLTPLTNAWKARAGRIQQLRLETQQGQALLERDQAIRARWEQMRRATLPTSASSAEQTFFTAVDKWAQESRVAVTALTPQWKLEGEDYQTLQCRIDATGDLGTLSRFIFNIEKDPIALRVENIELGSRDKDGRQLALAVQISGLVLKPSK